MAKKAYIGVGGSTESRLPAGYTELEYIESTSDSAGAGEQYIDTEVIPSTNDFSVVMKASARVIDAENWFLTINRQMPAGTATFLQFGVRGNSTFATHLTYVAIDGTTAATTDIVDITFSVQGTTATQTGDATHTMTNTNLQSGSYRNSSITIVNGNWRCYSCQIYLANTLVRDFVPCKNASGEVGLYDLVGKKFYGNAGSGSFIAGGTNQGVLPVGYTELVYIEGNGTQYIDTGFMPNNNTRVVLDARTTDVRVSEYHCVFGCRGGGTFFELFKASQDSWEMTFLYGGSFTQSFEIDYGLRHIYEINKNVATIDDETRSYPATDFQTAYSLYLGATNNSGSVLGITPMLIYSSQIYDNGTLIRDFVPCKSASGEVGLYDKVNAQFYGNAGTGSFTAGSTIMDGARQVKKMYIGVDGVARKVKKAYIGVNGVARLFYSGVADVAALAISYSASGGMTDAGIVTMSGKQYRLLTITKSGTLSVSEEAQAEVWMCGGGTSGESSKNDTNSGGYGAGGGGGAGAFVKTGNVKLTGSMVATIGAGGATVSAGTGGYAVGGASTFAGLSTSTAFTQQGISCGINGGTGGGYARDTQYSTVVGKGDGVTKYPFGDSVYFAHPHCAGGGGGNVHRDGYSRAGGDGGTNGGNGLETFQSYSQGGAGGNYGGGAGGAVNYNSVRPVTSSASSGGTATYYGSAGGGGAFMNEYPKFGGGGAGYQGIIYIRIPVEQ